MVVVEVVVGVEVVVEVGVEVEVEVGVGVEVEVGVIFRRSRHRIDFVSRDFNDTD